MNNRELRMFNIAKEISYMSNYRRIHVGAVVCEGKNVISTGYNSTKTRPLQHQYNIYRGFEDYKNSIPQVHAEINALSRLVGKKDINWNKVSIFIYREHQNGTPGCSKPCPACMALIKKLNIKNIYYIDEQGDYVKQRIL